MPGSNQRPLRCKRSALPTELTALGTPIMAAAGRRTGPREPAPQPNRAGTVARHVEASPWGPAARRRPDRGGSRLRARRGRQGRDDHLVRRHQDRRPLVRRQGGQRDRQAGADDPRGPGLELTGRHVHRRGSRAPARPSGCPASPTSSTTATTSSPGTRAASASRAGPSRSTTPATRAGTSRR